MKAMKQFTVGLFLAGACLAFPGLAAAKSAAAFQGEGLQGGLTTKVHAEGNPNRILDKLLQILDDIELRVKVHVRLGELVERLQSRKPRYEIVGGDAIQGKVKVEGVPAGDNPAGVTKVPSVGDQGSKARLLGDEEKKGLDAGVVALVDGLPVTRDEIKKIANFYETFKPGLKDKHIKDAFLALIKIRHIQAAFKDKLAAMEKRAQEIYKKAAAPGADFAKLAEKNSDGPSKSDGGNLGYFARPNMVPSFAAEAFSMKLGQVSKPFPSIFGYHIIKVEGRLKGNTPAEDQVKARHILVIFTKDQNKTRSLAQEAAQGKAKVALVDKKTRAILPASYR